MQRTLPMLAGVFGALLAACGKPAADASPAARRLTLTYFTIPG